MKSLVRVVLFSSIALCAFVLTPSTGATNNWDTHAYWIQQNAGITLLNYHVSGNYEPDSTARANINDAAAGRPSWRSSWGHYGHTQVYLKHDLLFGMQRLRSVYGYSYRVTSIAGGRHGSSGSYHYQGRAMDVDYVNGGAVGGSWGEGFRQRCISLGAIEAFGPQYDPGGHQNHLHCAW